VTDVSFSILEFDFTFRPYKYQQLQYIPAQFGPLNKKKIVFPLNYELYFLYHNRVYDPQK